SALRCPVRHERPDRQRWRDLARYYLDAVSSRRDHTVRIECGLDPATGITEGGNRLRHVKLVIVDRRAADEHAAGGDFLRHLTVAGVGTSALVGVLAVERDHVQTAGKAGAADIHRRVIEAELLVNFPAQPLKLVGDAAIHRRARRKPNITAARP